MKRLFFNALELQRNKTLFRRRSYYGRFLRGL